MEEQKISFIAYESMVAAMERANKRLAVIVSILFVLLVLTNAAWLLGLWSL